MKLKVLALFASFFLIAQFGYSQPITDLGSYKKNFREGILLIEETNYKLALEYFTYAYQYDSTNANINFNMGFCYLYHPTAKHKAEAFLEKAIKNISTKYASDNIDEKHAPVESYFYLGRAYQLDGKLDDAEKMFETYDSFLKTNDKEGHRDLDHYKQMIKNARQYMAAPVNAKISNMGDSINSPDPEYSAVISADERMMIYTKRSKDNVGGSETDIDGYPYEDIVVAFRKDNNSWTSPASIGPYINTIGHEASVSLSPDGQTLVLYREENNGDLYYSNYDGKEWSIPLKFGSNINSPYHEPSACFSRDGNTLYFVSDRPGGYGGQDIYRCVKLPNGQWSLALNLGPTINTTFDEESPYMSPDGITFYFASQGHTSMGGFDILFSVLGEDGQFSTPANLGYPINTTDDDLFLVASPDNKRFYYSSAHEDKNAFGNNDIYMITYEGVTSNPLALFKGQVKPGPCDSVPDNFVVVVSNIQSGELIGTYRPQRKTGTFSVIIPPGSKYLFSYQQNDKELFNEEIFVPNDIAYEEIQKALNLKPIKVCNGVVVNDDDTTKRKLALNLLVLNNKKDQKVVSNAKIKLISKGKTLNENTTNTSGKVENIALESEKNYDVVVNSQSKQTTYSFNTIGVKENKIFDKTIYLEKTAEENLKFLLNVTVYNTKKLRKPVANAKVLLTGTDDSKFEALTDEKGHVKNIPLSFETNYQLSAESGTHVSKHLVTTHGMRKSKTFEQNVFIEESQDPPLIADNSKVNGTNFKFYFKYNMNEIDEFAPEFITFINNLEALAKSSGGKLKLSFTCCASKVPTKKFKDNVQLSEVRLKKSEEKVIKALVAKGIAKTNIIISKEKAYVSGPDYHQDTQINKEEYEKFQFAEIEAEK